jgi:chromate transporter
VSQSSPEQLGIKPMAEAAVAAPPGRWRRAAVATGIGLVLWWAPVAIVVVTLGWHHVFVDIGLFFSKLAVVSFGGAYALLAYMAQEAVESYRWMTAPEMVDGLGLAETLPGPLIKITQFVGFLGAYRDAAPFSPVTAGVLGSALTTWVTFVPPMLLIFAGAPFIEQLRSNQRLSGALAAITAAVVGVILNLTVWFVLHVLFANVEEARAGWLRWFAFDPLTLDLTAAAFALLAALLAFRFHRSLVEIIVAMAALGIALRLALGS